MITQNCFYAIHGLLTNYFFWIRFNSTLLQKPGINTPRKDNAPLLQCTKHMCPVRVHWHLKLNYEAYWRVKVALTNFNFRRNYSQWTLVVQHPNLNNVTQVFSFNYKSLLPYQSISKCLKPEIVSEYGKNTTKSFTELRKFIMKLLMTNVKA